MLSVAPSGYSGTGYGVGDNAYDFAAGDQSGRSVTLSQFFGQYVVLEFGAEWCVPSRGEQRNVATTMLRDLAMWGYVCQTLTILLQDRDGRVSDLATAQRWAREFRVSTPVLHLGGEQAATWSDLGPLPLFVQFLSFNGAPDVGAAPFPTNVVLSPALRILNVTAGEVSVAEIEAAITGAPVQPADIAAELMRAVRSSNLDLALTSRLMALLTAVYTAIMSGMPRQAASTLTTFMLELTGRGLNVGQSAALMSRAKQLSAVLAQR